MNPLELLNGRNGHGSPTAPSIAEALEALGLILATVDTVRLVRFRVEGGRILGLAVESPQSVAGWRHSHDYRSVTWCGRHFQFSKQQAAAVEYLDHARSNGSPECYEEKILRAIFSESLRLPEVFRKQPKGYHDAWGTLIVRGKAPGTYRLADEEGDT